MSELERSRNDGVADRAPGGRSGDCVIGSMVVPCPFSCVAVFSLDIARIKGFRDVMNEGDSMRGAAVGAGVMSG